MLTERDISAAAKRLCQAENDRKLAEPLSTLFPGATVQDAYRVGIAVKDIKTSSGRTVKGHKIGLTSKPMQDMAGATEPDFGFIYDECFVPEGSSVARSGLNKPFIEMELAFVFGQSLEGQCFNAADVIDATNFILPSLEIVDSRYKGFGPNMLVDSISDAASCGRVVLGGNPVRLEDVDVRRISGSLAINGTILETGTASAVMANPINAVVWLANKLQEFGVSIKRGDVVLSGSFVRAVPINAGDTIVALFDQLGEVNLSVR